MFLLLAIYCLAQGMHTDASQIPPIQVVGLAPSTSCQDLGHCRTIWNIFWSCLVTVFSCTWVAVHPNIPRPMITEARSRFQRCLRDPLVKFASHRAPLFVCALLVPEYVLAWAIRQRFMAGKIAKKHKGWTKTHGFFVIMGGFHLFLRPEPDTDPDSLDAHDGHTDLLNPHDDDIPLYPLSIDDLEMHGQFDFALPTEAEIQDKSSGDWLAKSLVIIQTTWFVTQCIARGVQHLPVTELEIVTLAYATVSFATYLFWWNKPLNVERPVRVFLRSGEYNIRRTRSLNVLPVATWIGKLFMFIVGGQDRSITLANEEGVPIFWSGRTDGAVVVAADLITLVAGVIFGAIHCIAWSFSFQSYEERIIWRISCIAMVSVPASFMVTMGSLVWWSTRHNLTLFVFASLPLLMLLYIASRVVTVALAFTCLKSLPPGAYEAVHWTTFIPHI